MTDGLGSVLAEVGEPNAAGNPVKATRRYDVYGGIRANSETGTSTSANKFCGSLGHSQDDETGGLIYMRARYYDPVTGRFISEDPGKQGDNWFAYCGDNPISYADDDGQFFGYICLTMGSALSSALRNAFGTTATSVLAGMLKGAAFGVLTQVAQDATNGQFSGVGSYLAIAVLGAVLQGSGVAMGTAVKSAMIANGISTGVASFAAHMAAARLMTFEVLVMFAMGEGYDQRNGQTTVDN